MDPNGAGFLRGKPIGGTKEYKRVYVVTNPSGDHWIIHSTTDLHKAIEMVKTGYAESYFVDLLEASRRADFLRTRDGQPTTKVFG